MKFGSSPKFSLLSCIFSFLAKQPYLHKLTRVKNDLSSIKNAVNIHARIRKNSRNVTFWHLCKKEYKKTEKIWGIINIQKKKKHFSIKILCNLFQSSGF